MLTEKISMDIQGVGADDGTSTYEIRRRWGDGDKKALVIELYPTLTPDQCRKLDMSTMHLLNHAEKLGWNDIRIVNLYSKVFSVKPKSGDLTDDYSNLSYIESIMEEEEIKEYDIVIAWGNTLLSHMKTILAKTDVLTMLKDKGLMGQVKCIVTDNLDTNGVHPLYLGLRHSNDIWKLKQYPVEEVLCHLKGKEDKTKTMLEVKEETTEETMDMSKKGSKKRTSKKGDKIDESAEVL